MSGAALGQQAAQDFADTFASVASSGTLSRRLPAQATHDPATGRTVLASAVTYPIRMHFSDYKTSQVNGNIIAVGDRLCIIQALGLDAEPRIGDRILEGIPGASEVEVVAPIAKAAIDGVVMCWRVNTRGAK